MAHPPRRGGAAGRVPGAPVSARPRGWLVSPGDGGPPVRAGRIYFLPMLAAVAAVVGLLVAEFLRAPLPPGVDPGNWLSISYSYIGHPTAPIPANRPFFYAPLLFPFLGGLVSLTGSPPVAASAMAAILLAGYGLTVIHLARRFLRVGAYQLAFVGLALFSGTTLQMLFWGAYPNFLGFITMNEAILFFLLYVNRGRTIDAVAMFAAVGLTYLGDTLSFVILVVILATSVLYLLLLRQIRLSFLWDRRNVAGAVALGLLYEGYARITAAAGIAHPSYLNSNPPAYHIDEIGEIFSPLGHAPTLFPPGAALQLSPGLATLLLLLVPVAALAGLVVVRHLRPVFVEPRTVLPLAWISAAAAVPALGYLARVETDYTRFLYFLPLPFLLIVGLALEHGTEGWFAAVPRPSDHWPGAPPYAPGSARRALRDRRRRRERLAVGLVTIVLIGSFLTTTLPVAQAQERVNAGRGHDALFVAAARFVQGYPAAGNVLAPSTISRWLEALTGRNAITSGPVWLLFDPTQIVQTQEAYWAFCAVDTYTNGQVALSYSGFNTSVYDQAPLYSAYVDGIAFPVLRLLPGALTLTVLTPHGPRTYSAYGPGPPTLELTGSGGAIQYTTPVGSLVESASIGPGGSATIGLTVRPGPGIDVLSIGVALAKPADGDPGLDRTVITNLTDAGGPIVWTVRGSLGQYPAPEYVTTVVTPSEAATSEGVGSGGGVANWYGSFPDPAGRAPFQLELNLTTAHTSNPSRTLPDPISTAAFLAAHSIRFLVWPNAKYSAGELVYYEATFGFRPVYENAEWVVLVR